VVVTGHAHNAGTITLGLIAVVLATVNLVGGFVVTDRMLEMFKGRSRPVRADSAVDPSANGRAPR
jgi:NAD(P) transhydrogenase subunit alpha